MPVDVITRVENLSNTGDEEFTFEDRHGNTIYGKLMTKIKLLRTYKNLKHQKTPQYWSKTTLTN
jgi:hypothetical protein